MDALLAIVRRDWDPAGGVPTIRAQDSEWTRVIAAALEHGVAGLLCRSIRGLPEGLVAEDVANAAEAYLAETDASGAVRLEQLFDILDLLEAERIRALSFKGPVLGMLAHASPTIRPSRDIDVLVDRRDMARTVTALERAGYCLAECLAPDVMEAYYDAYGQTILHADGRLPVEPHSSFAPRNLAVDMNLHGLWYRAMRIEVAGRNVLSLSPEDTLLCACLHGAKERWWRLLWVADVAAFVHRHPSLDWGALTARARHLGACRMLHIGVGLARELFDTRLPAEVANAIKRDAACLRLVTASRRHLFAPTMEAGPVNQLSRYHFELFERVSDRARYVWRTLTTPGVNHFRMISLPRSLVGGYVAVKLVHDYALLPAWNLGKGRLWRRNRPTAPDVGRL